jgi:hypothetical protein
MLLNQLVLAAALAQEPAAPQTCTEGTKAELSATLKTFGTNIFYATSARENYLGASDESGHKPMLPKEEKDLPETIGLPPRDIPNVLSQIGINPDCVQTQNVGEHGWWMLTAGILPNGSIRITDAITPYVEDKLPQYQHPHPNVYATPPINPNDPIVTDNLRGTGCKASDVRLEIDTPAHQYGHVFVVDCPRQDALPSVPEPKEEEPQQQPEENFDSTEDLDI